MPLKFWCLESIAKLCGSRPKATPRCRRNSKPTGTCMLVFSIDKLQVMLALVAKDLFQYSSRPVGVFLSLYFGIEPSLVESIFPPSELMLEVLQ